MFDLTITNPDHQGVQDPSPTFDDHRQQLVWEGQASAAAAYYVTGILVQSWCVREILEPFRWLRNPLIMKVGGRRGRLCQRLVIKLTSCSSRHWHILQLNVMMGISHLLSLVNGISNECRKSASFKTNEQIQCGLKTNVVMVRELFTKNNVNVNTFSTSFLNTSQILW